MKNEPTQPLGTADAAPRPPEQGPALPSIIVDPSLGHDKPAAPDTTPVSAAPPEQPSAQPAAVEPNIAPPPPGFVAGDGDFDFASAERLASGFRPSWEPSSPGVTDAPQPADAVETIATALEEDTPLPELPGSQDRRRALLLTAGAVAFFTAMLALALRSSRPDDLAEQPVQSAPQQAARDDSTASGAASPEPSLADAPAPSPEPASPAAADVQPAVTEAEASPGALAPTAEPPPAAPPQVVHIRISTSPADAQLELDGAPVANPYDANIPKGSKHTLQASAVGHRRVVKTLTFDRDLQLSLELRPELARRKARPAPRAAPPAQSDARRAPVLKIESRAPKGAGFVADSPY